MAARAALGFAQLLLVLSIAVFGPAWTLGYWQAWLYLVVFAGCAAAITVYLSRTDPELLRRRLSGGPTAEHEIVWTGMRPTAGRFVIAWFT